MTRSILPIIIALCILSCTTRHTRSYVNSNQEILLIGENYFNFILQQDPMYASYIGEHQFDHLLPKIDLLSREQRASKLQNFLSQINNINTHNLSQTNQIRLAFLRHEIKTLLGVQKCRLSEWLIDQLDGPQISLAEITKIQKLDSQKDFYNLISRYSQIYNYFLTHIENLKLGLKSGLVAARINIQHVISQIEDQLLVTLEKSPYIISLSNMPKIWSQEEKLKKQQEIIKLIKLKIYPGLRAYLDFLKHELLPLGRTSPGIINLALGPACYQSLIERHTGLDKTPEQIHTLGLNEVSRIKRRINNLIKNNNYTNQEEYKQDLLNNPDQYLANSQSLVEHNRALVLRAQQALPMAFTNLPKTPIQVKPLEKYRAKHAPVAYYQQAQPNSTKPATYFLNTLAPETRPLFNMAALAFHEAVPGHHLQISLANENKSIPEFQRHLGQTAYVEGWALYAEILSRELGLYQNQAELFGSLNYELWRALRLVIDTGIHHLDWTREQAASYLAQNTAFTKNEVYNEIDRYIIWPGQALAYKIGQLEISSLRALCETKLKDKFSLGDFHNQILKHGAMPLSALRKHITNWLRLQKYES